MDLILSEGGDGCLIQCETDFVLSYETENFLSPPMTVNNSLSNEKMVGGLPRIGRFLLRNLACSALVPGPAAGHQCATSLAPLSDSFPAKWLSTQKNIANGRGCAFCHSQRVHMYPIPSDQDRTLLEVCHGCCPFLARLPCCSLRPHAHVRTRYSCLCNRSGDVPSSGPPLDERRSV